MIANYELTVENIKKYPFNSTKMCQDYLSIFKKMIENPEKKIISNENKILFQIKKKYFLILKRFKTKNY